LTFAPGLRRNRRRTKYGTPRETEIGSLDAIPVQSNGHIK
jgi:hypothetical protein